MMAVTMVAMLADKRAASWVALLATHKVANWGVELAEMTAVWTAAIMVEQKASW